MIKVLWQVRLTCINIVYNVTQIPQILWNIQSADIIEILTQHYFKYDNGHGSPKDAFLGTYDWTRKAFGYSVNWFDPETGVFLAIPYKKKCL